jgi:glycosyltransferase involved in cell wall biosynthesis
MGSINNKNNVGPIAVFLPSLRGGGAERVMVVLASEMAQKGYAVDLVVSHAEGPYLKEIPSSVRLIDLKSPRVLFCLKRLRRYLREERPVAILSTMTHVNIVALLAVRFSGVPMRSVIREANVLQKNGAAGGTLKGKLILKVMPFFYRWANSVVAVSEGVAKDLRVFVKNVTPKIKVIGNPVVDDGLFEKAKSPVPHVWFSPDSAPVVLGVGRLVPQKDFATLIEAFAIVRKSHECCLVILGEGPERSALENLVSRLQLKESVDFPGFVENPFSFMARSATYVLASRWEGLPNTLIQAAALGTPVVATDCHSGPREILEDGVWGRLVPVGDVNAMACAIKQNLYSRQKNTSIHEFFERYSTTSIVKSYLELLLRTQDDA